MAEHPFYRKRSILLRGLFIWAGRAAPWRFTELTRAKKTPIGLSPATLRTFCERVGIAEKPCASLIKDTVSKALSLWPELIEGSLMYDAQKEKLLARLTSQRFAKGVRSYA